MNSHELARQLLVLPDLPVEFQGVDGDQYAFDDGIKKVSVEMVVTAEGRREKVVLEGEREL